MLSLLILISPDVRLLSAARAYDSNSPFSVTVFRVVELKHRSTIVADSLRLLGRLVSLISFTHKFMLSFFRFNSSGRLAQYHWNLPQVNLKQ